MNGMPRSFIMSTFPTFLAGWMAGQRLGEIWVMAVESFLQVIGFASNIWSMIICIPTSAGFLTNLPTLSPLVRAPPVNISSE